MRRSQVGEKKRMAQGIIYFLTVVNPSNIGEVVLYLIQSKLTEDVGIYTNQVEKGINL